MSPTSSLRSWPRPASRPGGVSLYCEALGAVFTGKTLQADGPGKLGGEYPRLADQLTAIGGRLFTLPHETRVLAAHGEEMTIGDLEPHFDDWISGSLTRGRARGRARGPAHRRHPISGIKLNLAGATIGAAWTSSRWRACRGGSTRARRRG